MELAIVLAVVALIAAPLLTILYQMNVLSDFMGARSAALDDVRTSARWLASDGPEAQVLVPGDASQGVYGSLDAADFLGASTLEAVTYAFAPQRTSLDRAEGRNGQFTTPLSLAQSIQQQGDVSFVEQDYLLTTRLLAKVQTPLRMETQALDVLTFLRAPISHALPAGGLAVYGAEEINWSGSKNGIIGRVHTNGVLRLSGSRNRIAGDVGAGRGMPSDDDERNTIDYRNERAPLEAFPVSFTRAQFPCTLTFTGDVDLKNVDAVWLDQNKTLLREGTYCTNGKLSISGSKAKGRVTLIGAEVSLSGSDQEWEAFARGVLAFATIDDPQKGIHVSGSGSLLTGLLYAPQGEVTVSGSDVLVHGSIYGEVVRWSGSDGRVAYNTDLFAGGGP